MKTQIPKTMKVITLPILNPRITAGASISEQTIEALSLGLGQRMSEIPCR